MLCAGPKRTALKLAQRRAGMVGDSNVAEKLALPAHRKSQRAEYLLTQKFIPKATRDEAQVEHQLATKQSDPIVRLIKKDPFHLGLRLTDPGGKFPIGVRCRARF